LAQALNFGSSRYIHAKRTSPGFPAQHPILKTRQEQQTMPRRGGGGFGARPSGPRRSNMMGGSASAGARAPPPPAAAAAAAPPRYQPPPHHPPVVYGGGAMPGLMGSMAHGMAVGAGASMGSRATDAMFGPRQLEMVHRHEGPEGPQQHQQQLQQTSPQSQAQTQQENKCWNYQEQLAQCLQTSSEASNCQGFLDSLKACQQQLQQQQQQQQQLS